MNRLLAAVEAPRIKRLPDAADWTIVLAHGGSWVGKLEDAGDWLDPGLALDIAMTPGRMPGAVTIAYRCRPALYLVSWHRIRVPPGAHVQPCADLSPDDWHQIATAIDAFEENMAKTLAARSGIVLPQ